MTAADNRPNLLYIFTDQQSFDMMSCAGNDDLHTPAMDSIAESGVRFDRAYCADPVCVPSRFSMMTGRMPSAIGQRGNKNRHLPPISDNILNDSLGHMMTRAGYDAVYGGKVHMPKNLNVETAGFRNLTSDQRDSLPLVLGDYLQQEHDKPFAMVASFINPHDICYMGIRAFATSDFDHMLVEKGETEMGNLDLALNMPAKMDEEEFFANWCPELPPNYEPQEDEPAMIQGLVNMRTFRQRAREEWTDRDWRRHRWAYARLTEYVDGQIGRLLHALRNGPHADNTIIIFSSDHGDHDGSHKLEHKTALYDEAMRIPFLVSGPGIQGGRVEQTVVSNGLDLLPTMCDYAGVEPAADLEGRSLRPVLEGGELGREYVPIECQIGYAIVTDDFVYALYDGGANREQLYDLEKDPYQTRNALNDAGMGPVVKRHRELARKQWPSLNVPKD
jgi:choline-sulfatase